jgi:hypothetical protein
VQGAGAAGSAVVGNPLLAGISDGTNVQYLRQPTASNANQQITGMSGVALLGFAGSGGNFNLVTNATPGDGVGTNIALATAPYLYNGVLMDRTRNNVDATLRASGSVNAGTTNYDITNYNGRFIVIHYNVTSYGAAGTVTIALQMKDANGLFVTLKTTTAVSTGADILLFVGPNSWPADASPIFYGNAALPRTIRIVETVAGNAVTMSGAYSIEMC